MVGTRRVRERTTVEDHVVWSSAARTTAVNTVSVNRRDIDNPSTACDTKSTGIEVGDDHGVRGNGVSREVDVTCSNVVHDGRLHSVDEHVTCGYIVHDGVVTGWSVRRAGRATRSDGQISSSPVNLGHVDDAECVDGCIGVIWSIEVVQLDFTCDTEVRSEDGTGLCCSRCNGCTDV